MRLKQPFLKLPIRFDADALAAEARALPPSAWTPHPTGFVGNEAVRLVTPDGEDSDNIEGPMAATDSLNRCDYVRQIMAEIGGVWGRSRFMGLAPGREVPPHIDIHYYWRTHLRIHIPVITNPGVLFTCGDETVHMAAGECWVFNSFLRHDVQNKGDAQRIHLVLDTVGGGILPELMRAAEKGGTEPRLLAPGARSGQGLVFEQVNSPKVMSPWEMRCHLAFIREQAGTDPKIVESLDRVESFIDAWAANWARFGTEDEGRAVYEGLLKDIRASLTKLGVSSLEMPNEVFLGRILEQLIFQMALAHPDSRVAKSEAPVVQPEPEEKATGSVILSGSAKAFRPADRESYPKSLRPAALRREHPEIGVDPSLRNVREGARAFRHWRREPSPDRERARPCAAATRMAVQPAGRARRNARARRAACRGFLPAAQGSRRPAPDRAGPDG